MAARQSKIEKLHEMYVAALTLQLQAEPNAAILAVIGNFLSRSGVKAVDDSPTMKRLTRSFLDLPFKDNDELPTTNEKAKH
jgi:hypothetical protein